MLGRLRLRLLLVVGRLRPLLGLERLPVTLIGASTFAAPTRARARGRRLRAIKSFLAKCAVAFVEDHADAASTSRGSLPRPPKRRSLVKCPTALEAEMDRFIARENIKRYSKLASESTDATERSRILKFLAKKSGQDQVGAEAQKRRSQRTITRQRRPRIGSSMTKRGSEVVASRKAAVLHANRLLGLLPPRDYERLRPHLHRISLEYRQSLYRAHKPIRFVYFIETGVGSLVNTMANGQASEVGTIGNEGLVGLPLVLGDDRAPTSVYIQVPGTGLRMKATLFKKELARSASMRTVILHYAHAFFNQVAQSAACNQFHSIEQRCCRWLLMTHDRMQSDEFLLTLKATRGQLPKSLMS